MNDIRWKQRFQNFNRAFLLLNGVFAERKLMELSDLEQEGVIQRFEFCYELAWKTMKDFLDEQGAVVEPLTPRAVIKAAYAAEIISDGQVWIDMMLHRNILSHNYDSSNFKEVLTALVDHYLQAFRQLHVWFKDRLVD